MFQNIYSVDSYFIFAALLRSQKIKHNAGKAGKLNLNACILNKAESNESCFMKVNTVEWHFIHYFINLYRLRFLLTFCIS